VTVDDKPLADPVEESRRVISLAASIADPDLAAGAAKEIKRLRDRVEQAPKGLRWRTRAKVGDRARWYELPEEVGD
jgi:hypothetical protein